MGKIQALTGNKCATYGAALCRPDLIAAYPITPQSSVVEGLADLVFGGKLDSRMVQVESEHSAMSVVQGAAAAGGRVFTATSAQGLALMYEPYFRMSTLRLPMVMAIATREMTSPETIWSGQQDAMSVREAGWIQCFCETNQEILDMIIQGYMLAEDERVLIPVNVCYDGFYSSHLVERVDVPAQAEVDAFLPPYTLPAKLDPATPQALDPMTPGELLMKYRRDHLDSMQAALPVIDEVDKKFAAAFGRSYGGAVDTYRVEDADLALVTVGGMTGPLAEQHELLARSGKRKAADSRNAVAVGGVHLENSISVFFVLKYDRRDCAGQLDKLLILFHMYHNSRNALFRCLPRGHAPLCAPTHPCRGRISLSLRVLSRCL